MIDSEQLKEEVYILLKSHHKLETFNHCLEVGDYAYNLAVKFNLDGEKAKISGYLHDVSAIYPNEKRIEVAENMGIKLIQEELLHPIIIHQKISKEMAEKYFHVNDQEILSAIECHTTLKGNFSELDLVVFVADKIKWDQKGNPPYLTGLLSELEVSLERAALYYINYIIANGIKIMHPWLSDAQKVLINRLGENKSDLLSKTDNYQ